MAFALLLLCLLVGRSPPVSPRRFDWSTIWVRVGEYDFRRTDDTPHRDIRIADFRLHSNFNSRTFENDIALLILEQPVTFNNYVRKICLPPAGQSFINTRATVTGECEAGVSDGVYSEQVYVDALYCGV